MNRSILRSKPLKHSELLSIFKEFNIKRYRFTVDRFFDFVNATEAERQWFNKLTVKEERKAERKKAKEERNAKVKELYEAGHTIVAISNEVGVSRPTIYKILEL